MVDSLAVVRGLGSLDTATQLARPGWCATVYPDALEGSVSFRSPPRRRANAPPSTPDSDKNRRDAARRAAGRLRRFVVANRLGHHVTLTWSTAITEPDDAHKAVRAYLRRLRRCAFEDRPFPWAYVVERGERTRRLHAHVLTPSTFAEFHRQSWDLGRIDVRPLPGVNERRAAAEYLAKGFDSDHEERAQRFRVAQGFRPQVDSSGPQAQKRDALAWTTDRLGRQAEANVPAPGFGGGLVHHLRWDEDDDRSSARRVRRRDHG